MLFMVPDNRDANSTRDVSEQEVIWETPQIDPPLANCLEMKMTRVGGCPVDEQIQFFPKLITQPCVDAIVIAQNP